MNGTAAKEKYEIWEKFAFDKIIEGSLRMQRNLEQKKDLQAKQMELEIGRLNTIIEMQEVNMDRNDESHTLQ